MREDVAGVLRERADVAEGVVQVEAPAVDRDRRVLHPELEGLAGLLVEGVEDLVDLDLLGDLGALEVAALLDRRRRVVAAICRRRSCRTARWRRPPVLALRVDLGAGGELDVGLAQQRLLAQDRLRVRGDRRVLRVDLDRRRGSRCPSGGQLEVLHLADGDAADADVGLLLERDRLREVGGEAVALRLERDRAAEGDPEEEQQREARQREADRDQDPAY